MDNLNYDEYNDKTEEIDEQSPEENEKEDKGKRSKLWLIVFLLLLLIILVLISGTMLFTRLGGYIRSEGTVIELVGNKPGFEAYDDDKIWKTNTSVDIFSSEYRLSDGGSVKSNDGTKIIAPLTGDSYCFSLKNSGDVPVEYTLSLSADVTVAGKKRSELYSEFPVLFKLRSADNKYFVGNNETYVSADELKGNADEGVLDVNNYADYVLDWKWVSEDNTDSFWQELAKQDVMLELTIYTSAQAYTGTFGYSNSYRSADEGSAEMTIRRVGGTLWLWPPILLLILIMLVVVNFLYLRYRRAKERYDSDEEDAENEYRQNDR